MAAEREPAFGLVDPCHVAHVDGGDDRVGLVGGVHRDGAVAGVGVHEQVIELATFGGDGLGETTDAVPAHLGT